MNKRKLFSDYLFNLIRMILNIGLPVITLPFVLNRIGPENYGVFSYVNSIIAYFTLAAVLGIPEYASRAIARLDDRHSIDKTVSEIYVIQFISVSIALLTFFTVFYPLATEEYKPVFLILSILIGGSYFNTEWFYIGQQRFKYIASRSMVIKLLNVAAILLTIKEGDNSYKYALIVALTSLGNGLVNIAGMVGHIRLKDLSIKPHIKPIFVLFGLSIAGLINSSIDKTLTGVLVGPLYVGYYAVGFRLTRIVQQLFSALNYIIFPRITAYLAKNDEKQSEKLIRFNMDYILLFSFPIILGLILYAEDIVRLFFDADLLPATGSLIILTGTVPFIAVLNVIRRHVLLPRNKDKILIVLSIITTMTNIITNLILVPHFKHLGAAAATLMAEGAGMLYGLIYIQKKFGIKLFYPSQLKYLMAVPVLFIPRWLGDRYLIRQHPLTILLIQIVLSILLYFIILFLIRDDVFYRYTNRYSRRFLNKRRKN